MRMSLWFCFGLSLVSMALEAKVHEIKMLNKGSDNQVMVFEPAFVSAEVGDSIRFIPTDRAHSVQSLEGGLPAGIKSWKSGLNKEITIKLEKEGLYAFKCLPHYAMGMVGLVQAGKPLNLESVKAINLRGKSRKNFDKLLTLVK